MDSLESALAERMLGPVLADRDCGSCTACCFGLDIATPDFVKPIDQLCTHCVGGGCSIYDQRPSVCRTFQCVWRRLPMLPDDLKPDRSGVIILLDVDPAATDPFKRLCFVARWVRDESTVDDALPQRLLDFFRHGNFPAWFSPFASRRRELVHPSPTIYRHVTDGIVATGELGRDVERWRSALPPRVTRPL